MKKTNMLPKILALLMAFSLLFSVAAFAAEEFEEPAAEETVIVDEDTAVAEAETTEEENAEPVVVDNSARNRYMIRGGIAVGICVIFYLVILVLSKKGFKGFNIKKKKSTTARKR